MLDERAGLGSEDTEHPTLTGMDHASDQGSDSTDDIEPYDDYKLEKSLIIYLRESRRYPLLTKEDEIFLFAQIEEGQKIIQKAASEMRPGSILLTDNIDELAAKIEMISEDVSLIKKIITHISSGMKPMDLQIARLIEIAERRSYNKLPTLNIRDKEFLHDRTMNIARELLESIQNELGADSGNLSSILKQAQHGIELIKDAKKRIIEANLCLVVSIVKRYSVTNAALSASDLIQEGNLGLMKAVDRFRYQKGYRFSTYAFLWIRQSITRAIANHGRAIRLPVGIIKSSRELNRILERATRELSWPITIDEIADQMQVRPEKVQKLLRVPRHTVSLDKPIGTGDSYLVSFIEDKWAESPENEASNSELLERIDEVLSSLSEREEEIIRLRFGIDNGRDHTLEQIGRKFGVSREWIRHIEKRALGKLRHPAKSRLLRDFA